MTMYQSNISEIVRLNTEKLQGLGDPDKLLREVATGVLPSLKKRVHVDGKSTDGSQIGTYSPAYMKIRTGKGKGRKYNRTADTKVIVSLTRQLENDWSVIATPSGYGLGFKNVHNFDKSQWVEGHFNKRIWGLSVEEHALAVSIAQDYVNRQFNNP